ncbi:lysophospholipid transporter LplT [Candidatus Nitrotoga sp. AM1P]|uniref:lysophospholipid transporter LplT n=1 Tax=Candidatus Nitrotoga sp. AM1P TaxID=2559597 RepID=UPI0010AFC0EF|nr:lysophospholipid transporter LplT [Candidatus Nitrotoga sp. AM1P]BBJ24608.1 lysophospholipid transporter LplT [Candidatus Nitrotoga sp. AM1P]
MNRGFYIILAAQFFSALADNALLFAAIALLHEVHAPEWHTPILQAAFVVSYIVLAPFVGAFADSLPKGRVMFISNSIKLFGCIAMLVGVNPLLAYAVAGLGAAAYSPAKYGILTEYLPSDKLVLANSWIEGLTVAAIVLGAVVGGILIGPNISGQMLQWWDVPIIETGIDSAPELAISIITVIYLIAALFNLYIPRVPIEHKPLSRNPGFLVGEFAHCFKLLWKDPLGQVSLSVTTLFWGAGATLRLIVLAWAVTVLHYDMGEAAKLTAWVAIGIAIGSVLAAKYVKLEHSVKVLPVGIAMGLMVLAMIPVTSTPLAIALLIIIGAMGGYLLVPMNALLQHRGHLLMGAGRSIAVQNFNENISIFAMLALFALMQKLELSIYTITLVFGLLLAGIMTVLYKKHSHDQDRGQM